MQKRKIFGEINEIFLFFLKNIKKISKNPLTNDKFML